MSKDNIILNKLLSQVVTQKASELHLSVGEYPILRVANSLLPIEGQEIVNVNFMKEVADWLTNEGEKDQLEKNRSLSTVYVLSDELRFKVHLFFQKGTLAGSFRLIPSELISFKGLGLPKTLELLANLEKGLIIVAGPFDAGKTATASAFIEYINRNKNKRILTLEQPIEYVFVNNRSIIEQREVGRDTLSYAQGLKDALLEDVDVIMIADLIGGSDLKCLLELAETGRLVILEINADSTVGVINKLIEYFSEGEKLSIRTRLAAVLGGIVSQRLAPRIGGGRVVALELVINNNAVRAMIREDRLSQLDNLIAISRAEGMVSLDHSLVELVKTNEILIEDALKYSLNPINLKSLLNLN